ncbi:unnamed protein product [Ectocarpus fasciculatus]
MFRKDLGGSQVWAGSVEIELHYIPEGEAGSPARGGRVGRPALDETDVNGGGNSPYPPMSPSATTTTSLASSFVKAALSLPQKPRASGGADGAAAAAAVQAELLALSPRTATRGTEKKAVSATKSPSLAALARASSLPFTEKAAASSCSSSSAGVDKGGGGGESGRYGSAAAAVAQEYLLPLSPRMARGAEAAVAAAAAAGERGYTKGGGAGGWSWKSFFCGVVCSVLLVFGVLWAVGVPQLGFGLRVLEDGGDGRQAVVLIHGSKISGLADRHLVVFVGEQEVCRGGVPAPAPPTEGSSWAYDLWSSDSAAAAAGDGGDGGKGRNGRGGGREQHVGDGGGEGDCGRWCSFSRRLAAPLYAARRDGGGGGGGGGLGTDL